MPSVKLRTKLVAGTFGSVLLLGLAIIIFVNVGLTKILEAELRDEGIFWAEHLASMCVDPLLTEKHMNLQMMINGMRSERAHLEYVFLVAPDNTLIAHTFEQGFPAPLKQANVLRAGQQYGFQQIAVDRQNYVDVVVPILGGQLGTFHLGISEGFIQKIVKDTIRFIVAIIGVFLIVGSVMALYYARRMTKPLADLVEAAQMVGKGDLGKKVVVTTNDEIGLLGKTFNTMRENILETLDALKTHQNDLEKKVFKRTNELREKNTEIETNRKNLQRALDELSSIIEQVTREGKVSYYTHPALKQCWEVEKCSQKQCPCYGKEPLRCWQIEGTLCRNEVQKDFEDKYDDCLHCDFYKMSTSNPILQIGEQFNNMMFILEKNNKKLADAYQKLKQSQATILQQEKMASVGQLAAGVAHEINNPMGFISSNLNTLHKYVNRLTDYLKVQAEALESQDKEQAQETLKDLRKKLKLDYILKDTEDLIAESQEGAERVKEIVQNLKSFSRVDQAKNNLADINECLENTIKMVWNELKYKTTVNKEYGDLPLTKCYPQQLNQVFMNLLVNAAQAIEKQGVITIKTWSENNSIFVSISDTGCGIPEKNLAKLFEPFFTTKDIGKGTGLGLNIAYNIITKKHNGELSAVSEEGEGATFTVSIPVVEEV